MRRKGEKFAGQIKTNKKAEKQKKKRNAPNATNFNFLRKTIGTRSMS